MKVEEEVTKNLKSKNKVVIKAKDLLSSGSSLLNLGATGRTVGCFKKGNYYWFVGDSQSGKTFLALTCFAEACINPSFDDYRIIYDNTEDGALMDIERYFGQGVVDRLEPPAGTKDNPQYSEISEDFYYNIDDCLKDGRPFIYVLDSMDALDAKEDKSKFQEMKKARKKEREGGAPKVTGSYGMAKAKVNSTFIRNVIAGIRKSKSIVIIISQTRDNAGFGAQFEPKTAAGGRSLKFYATLEIWTSRKNKIKKVVKGKPRTIGILSKVQLKKNRITGKDRTVYVPIYYSVGIDDVGSCINYLIEEGHWKGNDAKVTAPEFDHSGSKENLVKLIEEEGLEADLRKLVRQVWDEIEQACEIKRKSRY